MTTYEELFSNTKPHQLPGHKPANFSDIAALEVPHDQLSLIAQRGIEDSTFRAIDFWIRDDAPTWQINIQMARRGQLTVISGTVDVDINPHQENQEEESKRNQEEDPSRSKRYQSLLSHVDVAHYWARDGQVDVCLFCGLRRYQEMSSAPSAALTPSEFRDVRGRFMSLYEVFEQGCY